MRYLTGSDFALFRAIRSEALLTEPDAFGETIELFRSRAEVELLERFLQLTRRPKNIVAVLEEGAPVGMCGFGISDEEQGTGFLWGMYVSASVRNRGVGRRMLSEAEQWVAGNGGEVIRACVAASNATALQFYRNAGYTVFPASGTLREDSAIPLHPIEKAFPGS